jgi:GNAT superfamily N-acetyltransferase
LKLDIKKITIKLASTDKTKSLANTIRAYCKEILDIESTISPEAIEQDGFGKHFQIVVAENSKEQIVGFAAWERSYDLHWGVHGGNILDMYVMKEFRGFGIAHKMLTFVCEQIYNEGGVFLKGEAIDQGMAQRMSGRISISVSGTEYILSGRAFREFARLSGKSALEIARGLPTKDMNYQS